MDESVDIFPQTSESNILLEDQPYLRGKGTISTAFSTITIIIIPCLQQWDSVARIDSKIR